MNFTKLARLIQQSIILMLPVLFISCVHLKTPIRNDLVKLQTPMVIGKYPITFNRSFTNTNNHDTTVTENLWEYMTDSFNKNEPNLLQATHIELQLIDKKHLKSILFNGKVLLETAVQEGRLRKGYFRTHDLSLKGVPPIYWAMTSFKKQFGIGNYKQLYLDSVGETNGGFLIFTASVGGYTRSRVISALP